MRIIVCDTYEEASEAGAKLFAGQITLKPDSILGLATGSTPIGLYECLVKWCKEGKITFKDVETFNLDEYYPIAPDNDQSYRYFMNTQLFDHIDIDKNRTHVLNGLAKDPEAECAAYEEAIKNAGGIDMQLLGIGQNGHIGFNEPEACLHASTHLTGLTENTIEANSRFFEKIEDVPTQSLTMGMATILSSKKIVLLACGKAKHKVVRQLLTDEITTDNPATLLKVHPDVVLICDKESYNG